MMFLFKDSKNILQKPDFMKSINRLKESISGLKARKAELYSIWKGW